ncbi:hypothetical protein D3C81_1113500 [compost metagenome]
MTTMVWILFSVNAPFSAASASAGAACALALAIKAVTLAFSAFSFASSSPLALLKSDARPASDTPMRAASLPLAAVKSPPLPSMTCASSVDRALTKALCPAGARSSSFCVTLMPASPMASWRMASVPTVTSTAPWPSKV